jgi:hypothetical protein
MVRRTAVYEACEHADSAEAFNKVKVKVKLPLCSNRPPALQPIAHRYVGSLNLTIITAAANTAPGTPEAVRGIHYVAVVSISAALPELLT